MALTCSFLAVPEAALLLCLVLVRPGLLVPWTRVSNANSSLLKFGLLSHLRVLHGQLTKSSADILARCSNVFELSLELSVSALPILRQFKGPFPTVHTLTLECDWTWLILPSQLIHLGKCFPNLRKLGLGWLMTLRQVTLGIVATNWPDLSSLSVELSGMSHLLVLKRLKNLESCRVSCASLDVVRKITEFSDLRSVELSIHPAARAQKEQIRLPAGVREFFCWDELASNLSLELCSLEVLAVDAHAFLHACRRWPASVARLKTLETEATDAVLAALSRLHELSTLRLCVKDLPDCGTACPSVRFLTLDFDGRQMGSLAWLRVFPNLEDIQLEACSEDVDPGFEVFDMLPKLQRLVKPGMSIGRRPDGKVKRWLVR